MKNILTIISTIIVLFSCTSSATEPRATVQNDNYVVVLDLSDRLIQRPDQTEIDTCAIRAAFEKFEKSVQSNLVVKSRDKFSIRIIPQHMSSLPSNFFENNLSIDMGKYSGAEKLKYLNHFKSNFSTQLNQLYHQAFLGNKNSDFAGVDIWQYFNEQINSDLENHYENKVLIITDGYFDFEDKKHGFNNNNFSTTTTQLLNKMNRADWKEMSDKNGLGILPVKLNVDATWQVCGIQSKVGNKDLLETDKLCYLWKKWLTASGAKRINNPIINSSSLKVQNLIVKSL